MDGCTYPWSEGIDCNFAQHEVCEGQTVPVDRYPEGASPYGALHMAGNAREWVSSQYQPFPYDSGDGREDLQAKGLLYLRKP